MTSLDARTISEIADELALSLSDLLGGFSQQGQRGTPGDEPAEVGRELAVELVRSGGRP